MEIKPKNINPRIKIVSHPKPVFLKQTYYIATPDKKLQLLINMLKNDNEPSIVYCDTREYSEKLEGRLNDSGINSRVLHTGLKPTQKTKLASDYSSRKFNVLITNDEAAKGLQINNAKHLYNYNTPNDPESFSMRVDNIIKSGDKIESIAFICGNKDRSFFRQVLFNYYGNITVKKAEMAIVNLKRPISENGKNHFSGKKIIIKRGSESPNKKNFNDKTYGNVNKHKSAESYDSSGSPLKSMDYYNQTKKNSPRKFNRPDNKNKPWKNY